MYRTSLKIADTIIQMQSKFPLRQFSQEEQKLQAAERFNSFFYDGKAKPDILIDVEIIDKLPDIAAETIFVTTHFQDKSENWRLLKKGSDYIYKSPLEDKKQLMVVNKTFDRVKAYLLPKKSIAESSLRAPTQSGRSNLRACHSEVLRSKTEESLFLKRDSSVALDTKCQGLPQNDTDKVASADSLLRDGKGKGFVWSASDIIYDFLQVLLINYFAQRKSGIFTHSVGIKDLDGKGLIFTGKSGAGKSTTARIWHKHSKAMVLNDDRIIVRKVKDKFFIYGSPWHGEFSDYLESRIESAPIDKIFFIHHAKENNFKRLSQKDAFNLLYPALFPTFWDKRCLENIASFSLDLVNSVKCYRLGFVNNNRVIGFVRGVD